MTDPSSHTTVTEVTDGNKTVADGLFPFVLAGLSVPIRDRAELVLEVEYDFDKQDGGFDLSGPIYMIGCRLRW